jgi:tetratricopeptide (TPR) repeat protein
MKFVLTFAALVLALAAPLRAQEEESLPERTLKQLVAQQKELLAEAAKENPHLDDDSFRGQMERICRGYEVLLRDNPKLAVGYASYGYLLGKLGQEKQAMAMLLKSNALDSDQPLVKNQIGNILAEQGHPIDALPYFLSAIKLAPKEPLYHYQLGTLLHEARDDFLKSGEWKSEGLNHAVHEAFRQAAELAPERIEFTYRYAESFYDLDPPDWDGALKQWSALEEKAATPLERETMRLHAANVLLKQGRTDHARIALSAVTEPSLQAQKQKLVAQLPPITDK